MIVFYSPAHIRRERSIYRGKCAVSAAVYVIPAVIVREGGYLLKILCENAAVFLIGFTRT